MTIRGLLGLLCICAAGAALCLLISPDEVGVDAAAVLLAFWVFMVGCALRPRRRV